MLKKFKKNKNIMFRTRRQDDHVQTRRFAVILVACVVLVLAVSLFVLLHGNDANSIFGADNAVQTTVDNKQNSESVNVKGDCTLLLHCENKNGELDFIWIAQIFMPQCRLKVCSVPVYETAEINGEIRTLQDIYKRSGDRGLTEAVNQVCGVNIDRYAGSDESELKSMINSIGGVDIEFEEQIKYKSSDFDLIIPKGTHSLKGDTYFKYFRYLGTLGSEATHMQCELLIHTFESVFKQSNASKSGKIFSNLSNTIDTNISIVDYTTQEAAINMLMKNGIKESIVADDYKEFAKK